MDTARSRTRAPACRLTGPIGTPFAPRRADRPIAGPETGAVRCPGTTRAPGTTSEEIPMSDRTRDGVLFSAAAALAANNGEWDTGSEGVRCWLGEIICREFFQQVVVDYPWVC